MVNVTNSIYDLTNSSEVNDVFSFVSAVNDLTGQTFMIGVLLASFIILFVAFMRFGTQDALFASGFITSVMTLLFTTLNLIPKWVVFLIIVPYGLFWAYRMVKG